MSVNEVVKLLESEIKDPSAGLPQDIFLLVSGLTPLVNVDLLIKDEQGRVLLSWRNDHHFYPPGWHVPGGIVRFKEDLLARIRKTSEREIGTMVEYDPNPVAINQIIDDHSRTRGHFISILYKCFLSEKFIPENKGLKEGDAGFLKWHTVCPENLIAHHEIYKKFM